MPESSRQAGQNVRDLALRRRLKAIYSFIAAGLVALFPFLLNTFINNFWKQLATKNSSFVQPTALQFQPLVYFIFILISLSFVFQGINLWQKANRADQGAKGEEDIAQVLIPLKKAGWKLEYGAWLGKGLGDADIICVSPKGQTYVVDVKSHRGEVIFDGKLLSRRMGKQTHQFQKDFLEVTMKQALQIKKQRQISFVTPIIAFSQAKVSLPANKVRGVYVVQKSNLLSLLNSLG